MLVNVKKVGVKAPLHRDCPVLLHNGSLLSSHSKPGVGASLLKMEEALQSNKTEYRGRWRRGKLEQSSKTSAVTGGVDQEK